jgi:hypothetical protein
LLKYYYSTRTLPEGKEWMMKILFIGYGYPGRLDDDSGPALAAHFQADLKNLCPSRFATSKVWKYFFQTLEAAAYFTITVKRRRI